MKINVLEITGYETADDGSSTRPVYGSVTREMTPDEEASFAEPVDAYTDSDRLSELEDALVELAAMLAEGE